MDKKDTVPYDKVNNKVNKIFGKMLDPQRQYLVLTWENYLN